MTVAQTRPPHDKFVKQLTSAVVRFAGDSGDGIQLVGMQLSRACALFGNDVCTYPDYPAEIRAPAGSLGGVSGFQIHFASRCIYTPGDRVHTLVALNPAALKTNLPDVEPGGTLLVNEDAFDEAGLAKAEYASNPLEDGSLNEWQLCRVPMTRANRDALAGLDLNLKAVDRSRNFFALCLVYWLYDRPLEPTLQWIRHKFAKDPLVAEANARSLQAGYAFGDSSPLFSKRYGVAAASLARGGYRKLTGNEAAALGLVTAAQRAGKPLLYASYPITPANEILHELARHKHYGVQTLQAEDEIAAIGAAVGAAFGGILAASGTSGPGASLKTEMLGFAVMAELPLVLIDVQRGGPSTGLPTKTEQADLALALFGRHGECPMPVLAPATPSDCFWIVLEAFRIATRYMTPVFVLSEAYLANGAERWKIPQTNDLPAIDVTYCTDPENFRPYLRDERLARPWAIPGTPGLEHRIGGLEKEHITGKVTYDPDNHERMVALRAQKIAGIADDIPPLEIQGPTSGELLVVSWGGPYGVVRTACEQCRNEGVGVSHAHFRHLNPLPRNTREVLAAFRRILVCELNAGQFRRYLQSQFPIKATGCARVRGKPLTVADIRTAIERALTGMR